MGDALLQSENLILIAVIILLLVCSAFFSSSETALTAASRVRMHSAEKDGDKRAGLVAKLLNMRERLLGGILLGNNLVNILASVLTTALFTNLFGAGGMALVISQLLSAGLLHDDVKTIVGDGLHNCACDPVLNNGKIDWIPSNNQSADSDIIASVDEPFDKTGGLALLDGNLGRAIIKISAVDPKHYDIEAPAKVFTSQAAFLEAFQQDELNTDFVAVLVNQGPRGNGMPELHKLTPALGVLQDKGFAVALVTDGRMSGASGKVPAAIHITPECANGGMLGKVKDGDIIQLKTTSGELNVLKEDTEWQSRDQIPHIEQLNETDGRILFSNMRTTVSSAETGALSLFDPT